MTKQLTSKPCNTCRNPVNGILRKDRKAFYYPKRCKLCQSAPSSPELKAKRRAIVNAIRVSHPIGTTRLHRTNTTTYRVIKVDNTRRWAYEHRVVAERMIGRKLAAGEVVHHVNEDTLDNRPENLRVMLAGEHTSLHGQITTWARKHSQCIGCCTTKRKHLARGYCTRCYQLKQYRPST